MPVLALAGAAWLVVLLGDLVSGGSGGSGGATGDAASGAALLTPPGATPTGHGGMHHVAVGASGASTLTLTGFLGGWILMVAAMMAPLLIPALHHVRARSLPRHRHRAMGLVTLGYLGVWVAAGPVLLMLAAGLSAISGWAGTGVLIGLTLAVAWQASPPKHRCLNRRGAHPPLTAFGRAADIDAMRFGLAHGAWCVGSCWALMLLPLLLPTWHVGAMVAVSLWVWSEQVGGSAAVAGWGFRLPLRPLRIARMRALSAAGLR